MSSCCSSKSGPGYASPADALKAPRETLLYVPGVRPHGSDKPDFLATIDVDPKSKDYSTIIHRLPIGNAGEELHHSGWNACSSCHDNALKSRKYMILPSLTTGNVHVVDTLTNPKAPTFHTTVDGGDIKEVTGLAFPHTSHCLGTGEIMVSMMGDAQGNGKGGFVLIDEEFKVKGTWNKEEDSTPFGYDFWYQPRCNVMVSSEWGAPNAFLHGFNPAHVAEKKYGHHLHFWDWEEKKLISSVDLGADGLIPLEVRFFHEPTRAEGFVGCALSSSVFYYYKTDAGDWTAEKVIQVEPYNVDGWALPTMPGLITDILLSMDDKYLYFSNWLHGDIRQYDVSNPKNPVLVGQIFIGGSLRKGGPVTIQSGPRNEAVEVPEIKGVVPQGGPQMLQLSLDGKRLYVTNSLFSVWDQQFYPDMAERGSVLLQIDVDTERGGLTINHDFLVDFGNDPDGPALAHEMRYPGGDCTSDIWI